MIRRLVDYALNNRLLVLAIAVVLFVWGIVSFHRLPGRSLPGRGRQLCGDHHAVAGNLGRTN